MCACARDATPYHCLLCILCTHVYIVLLGVYLHVFGMMALMDVCLRLRGMQARDALGEQLQRLQAESAAEMETLRTKVLSLEEERAAFKEQVGSSSVA